MCSPVQPVLGWTWFIFLVAGVAKRGGYFFEADASEAGRTVTIVSAAGRRTSLSPGSTATPRAVLTGAGPVGASGRIRSRSSATTPLGMVFNPPPTMQVSVRVSGLLIFVAQLTDFSDACEAGPAWSWFSRKLKRAVGIVVSHWSNCGASPSGEARLISIATRSPCSAAAEERRND